MKKLADYKGEEAIELWADLLEPITRICADEEIAKSIRSGKAPFLVAKDILKLHSQDAMEVMTRIDPTPVNGLNAVARVVEIVIEIINSEELSSFFGNAGQTKIVEGSFGSAMENTGAEEN